MEAKVDISNNTLKVKDKLFNLDDFRHYILTYWHPLARKNAIRPIMKGNRVLYTFDWAKIFANAIDGGIIIDEFLQTKGA